jgi:hypothetical protein
VVREELQTEAGDNDHNDRQANPLELLRNPSKKRSTKSIKRDQEP